MYRCGKAQKGLAACPAPHSKLASDVKIETLLMLKKTQHLMSLGPEIRRLELSSKVQSSFSLESTYRVSLAI